MSNLSRSVFEKLIPHLQKYYGLEQVNNAMITLLEFYENEAFDNEDIINDWILDDFDNCHGIHIFVKALNYSTQVSNPTNKQILFQWFCHWLLQNVPKPKFQPILTSMAGGFERIDKALAIHYNNCGREDYYNQDGDGKFMSFVKHLDENNIDLELGDQIAAKDCLYIHMDEEFPLLKQKEASNKYAHEQQIFDIIKYCYIHSVPPLNPQHIHENAAPLVINELRSFDFSMFNNTSTECNGKLCICIQRLLYGLKYYQMLNVDNEEDANKLVQFCKEIYTELLNDFIHIIIKHKDELDEIYDYVINDKLIGFKKCNVLNCKLSDRHNRDREKVEIKTISVHDSKLGNGQLDPNDKLRNILRSSCELCNTDQDSDSDSHSDPDHWVTLIGEEHKICHICPKLDDEVFYDVNGKSDAELELMFIRDLFDGIHCYILHQYDFGYRIHKKEKEMYMYEKKSYSEEKNDVLSCKDDAFAVIAKIIKTKKNILGDVSRFINGNKFTINHTESVKEEKDTLDADNVFIDKMFIQLQSKIDSDDLMDAKTFLIEEEYDSDSLQMDMELNMDDNKIFTSNLKQHLRENIFSAMLQYVIKYQVSKGSFATGFIFYYWNWYKQKQQYDEEKQIEDMYNINDHGGYKPHEFFVEAKYNDIKSEILHNAIYNLTLNEFRISLTKANTFMGQIRTRQMKTTDFTSKHLHYGIPKGRIPRVSNLLSIILYTDWSQLSTEFSNTFRKKHIHETISSVIKRNQQYANWSRLLRETVEGFGNYNACKGYFYCGMSIVMAMPEMNIRLCGPTSTSRQVEVAVRFGGKQGMLIRLQNYDYGAEGNVTPKILLRGFACGWLSCYNGEDEYLFMGGYHTISIHTIKHLSTCHNFERFVKTLLLFGCMIDGTRIPNGHMIDCTCIQNMISIAGTPNDNDTDAFILKTLINSVLNNCGYVKEFPKYINYTFHKMIDTKKTLIFNLYENTRMPKVAATIFYEIKSFDGIGELPINSDIRDRVNLFKPTIFELFPNVDKIVIYSNPNRGERSWHFFPFKLTSLLSTLPISNVTTGFRIVIKASWDTSDTFQGQNWLQNEFTPSTEAMYNKKKWAIKLMHTKNESGNYWKEEDCVVITKL